jgi:predicted ABC-type ATPase
MPRQSDEQTKLKQNVQLVEELQKALLKLSAQPDDPRPLLFFIAGPNGAGKSTVFELLKHVIGPIDFINADLLKKIIGGAPAPDLLAQKIADLMREHYLLHQQNFATETVFSDEAGAKLDYLRRAEAAGFRVVLLYICIPSAAFSMARVNARVANKGHAVPMEKLPRRYTASMKNCSRALRFVEHCILFDNTADLTEQPFRIRAITGRGQTLWQSEDLPGYIAALLPVKSSESTEPSGLVAANDLIIPYHPSSTTTGNDPVMQPEQMLSASHGAKDAK